MRSDDERELQMALRMHDVQFERANRWEARAVAAEQERDELRNSTIWGNYERLHIELVAARAALGAVRALQPSWRAALTELRGLLFGCDDHEKAASAHKLMRDLDSALAAAQSETQVHNSSITQPTLAEMEDRRAGGRIAEAVARDAAQPEPTPERDNDAHAIGLDGDCAVCDAEPETFIEWGVDYGAGVSTYDDQAHAEEWTQWLAEPNHVVSRTVTRGPWLAAPTSDSGETE